MTVRWAYRGGSMELDRPKIMGILNITPDSFSDGGRYLSYNDAVERAKELVALGADIVDVGGQSTRPGFERLTPEKEWARLRGILPAICSQCSAPVSVDTFYPQVAEKALDAGAAVINDVGGRFLADMARLTAESGCGYVLTCSGDISALPGDAAAHVRALLEQGVSALLASGVNPEQLALDPGIGFGKTRRQDRELILRAGECSVCGLPVLIGASRKRVIAEYWSGDIPPEQRDPDTHRAHRAAVLSGAAIVRVHDVRGAYLSLTAEKR